jgi:hypothetical protein
MPKFFVGPRRMTKRKIANKGKKPDIGLHPKSRKFVKPGVHPFSTQMGLPLPLEQFKKHALPRTACRGGMGDELSFGKPPLGSLGKRKGKKPKPK